MKLKYDVILLVFGLALSLIGMLHNIYASRELLGLVEEEKRLHISNKSKDQWDKDAEDLFQRKLKISSISYKGILFIASGFIVNILVQLYSKLT